MNNQAFAYAALTLIGLLTLAAMAWIVINLMIQSKFLYVAPVIMPSVVAGIILATPHENRDISEGNRQNIAAAGLLATALAMGILGLLT